ncbi:MAG: helix-turn-helix transcriptional regulator [Rhodocyclaceae bacterium]
MLTLAERLQSARHNAGLTQSALARQAGLSQTTISSLENGQRLKGSTQIARLAAVLGVNALWLAEGRGPRNGDTVRNAEEAGSVYFSQHMRTTELALRGLAKALGLKVEDFAIDAVGIHIQAKWIRDRKLGTSAAENGAPTKSSKTGAISSPRNKLKRSPTR